MNAALDVVSNNLIVSDPGAQTGGKHGVRSSGKDLNYIHMNSPRTRSTVQKPSPSRMRVSLVPRYRWRTALTAFGLGLCLVPLVQAGIVGIGPMDNMVATGDAGTISSINGIPVDELLVGTVTFPNPPKWWYYPASNASNFDLNLLASADDQPYFTITFDQAVSIIFIVDNDGNDDGYMQALDMDGEAVGRTISFTTSDFLKTSYLTENGQIAAGLAVWMDAPVHGIVVTPPDDGLMTFDPISVSATMRPRLHWEWDPENGRWTLVWFGSSHVLQQSSSSSSIWSDVPAPASSPYPVSMEGERLFFRLRAASPE
jgi:hypothetical protein